jgi:arginyl-tRNA synthetase
MKSGVTHYITGHEQKDHFKQLGFEKKHLPMGLVLGPDGKKMKSRDGNAFLASEAMQMVIDQLKEESEASLKIAWNIIAWNFLHVSRTQDIKFEPQKWTRPESPGMYITYTYARIWSAFREVNLSDEKPPLRQKDADLLGYANQYVYWRRRDGLALDPTSLANFAHSLAILLNQRYQSEKIIGGDYSFIYAMYEAYNILGLCMLSLGMFLVNRV